jgi:hypothetical protein
MTSIKNVRIDDIRADTAAQPRTSILTDKIADYTERMVEGDAFPPLTVFFDGQVYWLADGFHRYHAAVGLEFDNFPCDVREGNLRNAILFSVGANAAHGIQRANADKRRAVRTLLNDGEWSKWSDREIARICAVGNKFVGDLRRTVTVSEHSESRTYTTKHGTIATMKTDNIGKRPVPDAQPKPAPKAGASKPLASPADREEAINLARGLRTMLEGVGPITDRIKEIGRIRFWQLIEAHPDGKALAGVLGERALDLREINNATSEEACRNGARLIAPAPAPSISKEEMVAAPVRALSAGDSLAAKDARAKTSYEKLPGQLEMLDIPPYLDRRNEAQPTHSIGSVS